MKSAAPRLAQSAAIWLCTVLCSFASEIPKLQSIRIVPADITLQGARASQHLVVVGRYSDGMERDLTDTTKLSVRDPRVAQIDASARITPLAEGETGITAQIGALRAAARLRIQEINASRPFGFPRDIGAILTRRGCNSSECHGGVKGRAGFKLSVNALYPRDDYRWIVEGGSYQVMSAEPAGPKRPRINLREPEKSLLLLKPTASIAHGGGKRFEAGSADYRTILEWVRAGAPYGDPGAIDRIERIEVFPKEGILEKKGKHRLLVTAYLASGRCEDLTEEVLYVSNNPEVVRVDPHGIVEAAGTGETAIMIRAAGYATSTRFGVISGPVSDYPAIPRWNYIDEHVFAKLRKFNIVPSELSSDSEFLRRVCLDMTGTLPPPERVREFLASHDPRKREKLVETLLQSPEYVDYWTFRIGELFRASAGSNGAPEHGYVYWRWIHDSVAANKPYDQIARERIAAQGFEGASRHFLPYGREARPEEMMPEDVRVFLGRRLDCAQCHNHPFESWTQDQFWGLAAFYGQLNRTEWTGFGATVMFDDPAGREPDYGTPKDSAKVIHPRTRTEVRPAFLDGKPLPESGRNDPRLSLAEWMTSQPYFAETAVNRMWAYFFGRGLVNPVDDFRSTNPPTHPELLEALAKDFREHGYDLKHMIRTIALSRTYQLSATPNSTNKDDRINYSHTLPRPLDAEVLLDAISSFTGVPEVFSNSSDGQAPPGTRAINLVLPDLYRSRFLDVYGRPSRERVPERDVEPNLNQALHVLVGTTYTDKLLKPGSRLERLIQRGASNRETIRELYLAALSRFPGAREEEELEQLIARNQSRNQALGYLLWGLVTSREFAYNH